MSAQTIFRRAHLSNFVTISNALAREVTLSHRERGVLVWLLSYPVDWNVHLEALVTPDDSLRSLRRVVQRLEDAGYIKRERERDAITGRLGRTIFFVYDEPLPLTERSHDSRRKSPKTVNSTVEPMTQKRTVGATGNLTRKTPMTKNPSGGNWPTTKTEEDTKTEERETDALSELPDHLSNAQRKILTLPDTTTPSPNGDGGALAYTLIEAYCDAWDVTLPRYREQWHRAQLRGANDLAALGATPEEVKAMVAERREKGKQPDQCPMTWMATDYVGWKSRASKPAAPELTPEQRAARDAELEAERHAWREAQGLA